jgi:hypothetical protein
MIVVMHVMMIHAPATPSARRPAHCLLGDSFSPISCSFGVIGRLFSAASRRLSLRCCCLSALSSRICARGRLIGLIGRVDGVLLWSRVARGASAGQQRQKKKGAGQPNQL